MYDEEKVLGHKIRKMIYLHIYSHPGVSYSILKKVFDLTDGTLRYHLRYLEKKDKIRTGLGEGNRIYYPLSNEYHGDETFSKYRRPVKFTRTQIKVLEMIKKHKGITQKELIDRTGLKKHTVVNNINRLLQLNKIRRIRDGRHVYYEFISDEQLQHEILKSLVIKLLRKEIDEETFLRLKSKLESEKVR